MRFLVIEGNIGSGKTTLAGMLAKDCNAKLILEQFNDNPFLEKFYKDSERYGFPLELSFLAQRYNQIKKEILNAETVNLLVIADYWFAKTGIFAQKTLKHDEYDLFGKIYDLIAKALPEPDLYVYLHANTRKLLENIKKRGREYEKGITAQYLDNISNGYFKFFKLKNSFPILIIDINNIDFVSIPHHYRILKDSILNGNHKTGINRIILT